GSDTTDMLLRNSNSGGFEVYDISNNQITGAAFLGTVGLNWQVMGFGNFSSLGENDMMLRNSGTGGMQVYDIKNNQINGSALIGTVGLNWQMAGVSNHGTQSDLVLREQRHRRAYDLQHQQQSDYRRRLPRNGRTGLAGVGFRRFFQPQRRRHVVAQRQYRR